MFASATNIPFLFLSGAGAGVMGAILGIGGGVVLVPLLVIGFGVPMNYAVASSIVSVIATSSAAAISNVESRTANMRLGVVLEIATCLGALGGSAAAVLFSPRARWKESSPVL